MRDFQRIRLASPYLGVAISLALSACGPAAHGVVSSSGGVLPADTVQSASATFTFTFPKSTSSAKRGTGAQRAPAYLSSATASLSVQVTDAKDHGTATDIYANVPAALKVVQYFNPANLTGNPNTAGQCGTDPSNAGNYKCTAKFLLPVGDDTVTIASYSGANGGGGLLSQQILSGGAAVWVRQGVANTFTVSLDGNATAMTVSATSGYCAGSFTLSANQNVGAVGTAPVGFTASYTDPAGKAIVTPGLPLLKINGSSTSGTITGTGGNVTFAINQAAQTYTLAATNTTTSATINVSATPPASDGLSFNDTLQYTFSSGAGPPPTFLAVIEQNSAGAAGEIDFYTVTLGGSDSFSAYSTPTLAAQPPPGPANSDVDYPQDIRFDPNGDLLIANGGAGNPDFGNFACVPAGAISTGANAATILTASMNDPEYLELGTDNSVALGNVPASSAVHVPVFALGSTYAAAAASRTITQTDYASVGVQGLSAVPTTAQHPAGSFAVDLTNGTTVTDIVIKHPDGTVVTVATQASDPHVADPELAYDSLNDQLVVADNHGASSYVTFYSIAPSIVKQKQFVIADTGCYINGATPYAGCPPNTASGSSNMKASVVAASSSGYVALGGITSSGEPEVVVYDGTANRNPVGGPIPYDATTTPGGAQFTYGNATIIVHALRWLTGTKLLVSLESDDGVHEGLYTYDVTQLAKPCTCYDPNATQFPNSPKQTGFKALAKIPLSAAYRP